MKISVNQYCEHHWTISLTSKMTKVLLRILMKRARHHIEPEIGREQCVFVREKGTRNVILMPRTLGRMNYTGPKRSFHLLH